MRNYFIPIISFACLILISGSVSGQFNVEQLRVCSKEQQKQLFDSIVVKSFKDEGMKKNEHHFNFMVAGPRGYNCTAMDSTKEIYLKNLPIVSSEPPYDGSKAPQIVVHINAEGYISLAYTGYEPKSGEINLANKINRASALDLEKYKKEFEFVAGVLGITQGGKVQQSIDAHSDSVSDMAKKNLLRQGSISCEQSRIGKLVIKPLMKNNSVDYSLVLTSIETREKRKGNEAMDFVQVNGGIFDPANSMEITRTRVWNKDSVAFLICKYNLLNNKCSYMVSYQNTSEDINSSVRLDHNGHTSNDEAGEVFSNPEQAKFMQAFADRVIKYFE